MKKILIYITLITYLLTSKLVFGQTDFIQTPIETNFEGTVLSARQVQTGGQELSIKITNGNKRGEIITINTGINMSDHIVEYGAGDKILLLEILDPISGVATYYVTDFNRQGALVWLFILFVIVVVAVSKKWGITSIIGMIYSFFVIFKFLLPILLKGYNPLFTAILGAVFIAPVTFYLSHGLNKKTTVALVSTLLTLSITGIITGIFMEFAKITGFGSDEAFFLQVAKENVVNVKGIFLAGIIIGTLGILDDITVSQSAIVYQLKNSIRGINHLDLYKKAMDIGHDHIASAVNTLVLVYTGAALPLLLLFLNSSTTFGQAINSEIIADEIVRTLVGSIGLVLAVPISTLLAVYFIDPNFRDQRNMHQHDN